MADLVLNRLSIEEGPPVHFGVREPHMKSQKVGKHMREQCLVSGLETPHDSTRHVSKYIRSFYCKVHKP